MYNTSRRDHFLSLKPLKMAPYFFKPIDICSKSVRVGPENTFLSHLETTAVPHRLPSSEKAPQKSYYTIL